MKYFLAILFLSVFAQAQTVKFNGYCTEAATGKKQFTRTGFNFSDYPKSLDIIKDEGIMHAQFEKPLPSGNGKDKFVVLDKANGGEFSVNFFGTLYYDGPYFYELRFNYSYDAAAGTVKVNQKQTTYYQGKSSQSNEWNCELTAY